MVRLWVTGALYNWRRLTWLGGRRPPKTRTSEGHKDTQNQYHKKRRLAITGSWGVATKRKGGGDVKFYPYEKVAATKSFSHAEGGHNKFWGNFYVVA